MAQDFTAIGSYETKLADIASATVLEAGDIAGISSGLIIKAVEGSSEIAFVPQGSADGETKVEITVGNVTLKGTGDAVFAETMNGKTCDLVGTTTQLIDVGTTSTGVFKILATSDAGTVDSTDNIKVSIAEPINI